MRSLTVAPSVKSATETSSATAKLINVSESVGSGINPLDHLRFLFPSLSLLLYLPPTLTEATHVCRVPRGCGLCVRTCPHALQWGHTELRYPTAAVAAAAAEWNGKEKSCVVHLQLAYPPAVDTIMFRVWRTHSVLLTARGHMVRSRPQTVSPRVVHAREPRDEGAVQRTPEDKPAEEVEG
ncbi:Uncharacterized protein DBV15_09198 [Temnothorax longispinosus]|uniref:Uncharacterized protein n=1 Tax=Temnothorax longispinosus TaxID=300112 RepID=A0A4S2KJI9_9HYME|nr:Uncharacterized protein DBV15_09198 [Temnothorax longispinosus]